MSDVLMLVTNEYRPDPRVHKEARALLEGGHQVTVAAWDRLCSRLRDEVMEGVKVRRITTGRVGGQTALVLRSLLFLLKAMAAAKTARPDIVHAHDLDTLVAGILISRLRRIPLVYDAHERYAKMIAMDVPAVVSRVVERFERFLLPVPDAVITINEVMAAEMERHTRDKVVIIMNVIDLPPVSKVKVHEPHEVIVLFNPVTFEPMRYLEESIAAASRIENCVLRLAGSGRLQPAVETAARQHENIEFLGYLPFTRLVEEYEKVDVVLILADPANENYRNGTANKLGEGMAFGLPLLASKGTLSATVVEEHRCGLTFDWSEENFRRAVDELRDPVVRTEMGRRGRAAAEKEHHWGIMKDRLLRTYARLLKPTD
jgi:glycosyltransferase involved in cell wall biosynthesis